MSRVSGLTCESDRDIVAEPVVGWRAWWVSDWTFDQDGFAVRPAVSRVWLRSLGVARGWQPGVNEAGCVGMEVIHALFAADAPPGVHDAPVATCGCGFWTFRDRSTLERQLGAYWAARPAGSLLVLGRVEMWGRIVETELGWRAQYARPVDLVVIGAGRDTELVAAGLSRGYRVPVSVERLPATVLRAAMRGRLTRTLKRGSVRTTFVGACLAACALAVGDAVATGHWYMLLPAAADLAAGVLWWWRG